MNCTKPLKIPQLFSNFSTNVESQFSFNFRAKHEIKKSNVIHGVKNSNKIIASHSSFNFSAKINIESMYNVGYLRHENSNFFVFVTLDLDSKC